MWFTTASRNRFLGVVVVASRLCKSHFYSRLYKSLISSNVSLEAAGPAASTEQLQPSLPMLVVVVSAPHVNHRAYKIRDLFSTRCRVPWTIIHLCLLCYPSSSLLTKRWSTLLREKTVTIARHTHLWLCVGHYLLICFNILYFYIEYLSL